MNEVNVANQSLANVENIWRECVNASQLISNGSQINNENQLCAKYCKIKRF